MNQDPNNQEPNPLDQFVVNLQHQKEEELTKKHADQLGLSYQNLAGFQPNPTAVGLVPKEMAEAAQIFAFEKDGASVRLAIVDPEHGPTIDALKKLSALDEYEFKPVLVSRSSMKYLLSVYETFAPRQTQAGEINIDPALREKFSHITDLKSFQEALQSSSISDVLDTILAGASGLKTSDIHIEPTQDEVRLRFRLDGVLHDVATIPADQYDNLVNRIKLMASLKLNITEGAQDGRFSISAGDTNYDIRVSMLPTQYGESVVMRLLPQEGNFVSLEQLGLAEKDLTVIEAAVAQPNGLILNTGPTGSGKTTTLYAILNKLNSQERKIITVEDPIEYRLEGITQTQVNGEEDYSFASALRAIVRQDPDIILVGEIRDTETAEIAINASLTGHLVLSTLHTNDAAGAVPRLIDLKAKPELFADALRLIIAQRLVRKLCPDCKKTAPISPEQSKQIQQIAPSAALPTELPTAVGCDKCNGTGFRGRMAIYELLRVTDEIKEAIIKGSPAHELTEIAVSQGMTPLAQDGLAKVLAGSTSLEELLRVIETDNS